jgi:F0F1-type ATP synthase membrane subunit b/b'
VGNPAIILLLEENILSVDGSFLLIFILIIALIFILNASLFKPINHILEEREKLSAGRLSEAQQLLAQHSERLNHYEEQIRTARSDAYQVLEAQRKQAAQAQQEMMAQVRNETSQQIAAAKNEIAAQADAARAGLEKDAREMAATISAGILQRPVGSSGGSSAS